MGPDEQDRRPFGAASEGFDQLQCKLRRGGVGVDEHQVQPGNQGGDHLVPIGLGDLKPGARQSVVGDGGDGAADHQHAGAFEGSAGHG